MRCCPAGKLGILYDVLSVCKATGRYAVPVSNIRLYYGSSGFFVADLSDCAGAPEFQKEIHAD